MPEARGAGSAARSNGRRREESERRLLEATMALVAERGTEATSLADIAAAAGCSRGMPVYLFDSKQGLLRALVDEVMDRFRNDVLLPVLDGQVGLAALCTAVRTILEALRAPSVALRAFNVMLAESIGPGRDFAEPVALLHREIHELFAGFLAEARAAGQIGEQIDGDDYAWTLVALVHGAGLVALAEPAPFDLDRFIVAAIAGIRHALTPTPG